MTGEYGDYRLVSDRAALRGALPAVRAPTASLGPPAHLEPVPCPPKQREQRPTRFARVRAGRSDDWVASITNAHQRSVIKDLQRFTFQCAECGKENVSRLLSIGRRGCHMNVRVEASGRTYHFRVEADHRPPTVYAWTLGGNDTYSFQNTTLDLMPLDVRPPKCTEVVPSARATRSSNQYQDMIRSRTAFSRYDMRTMKDITSHVRVLAPRYRDDAVSLFQEFDIDHSPYPWSLYHLSWPYADEGLGMANPLIVPAV